MNFNARNFYQIPSHPLQPSGAHEFLPITPQPDKLEPSFDTNFGLLESATHTRSVLFNVIQSHGPYPNLLRRRAVVRTGLSLGLILGLFCFGAVCFLYMVGPQGIHVDSRRIDKGRFSDNRSIHLLRSVP